jgi:putative membrane protein
MSSIIICWVVNALALLLVAYLVPGIVVSSFYSALIVAVIIAIVNVTIKPLLLLLTLPISVMTLGLFALVINALCFWFVASFVDGFAVSGFWAAFFGALLFSVVTTIANRYVE